MSAKEYDMSRVQVAAEKQTKIASVFYVGAIFAANLIVVQFGPWFSIINSFLLIGLDLSLRDFLHDRIGVWRVLGLVVMAGVLSYVANPSAGMIAVASALSFVLANVTDTAVYQRLISHRWLLRANASNAAGAAVDSLAFPLIAFGALMPQIVIGQFLAKLAGGALWAAVIQRIRGAA